MANIKAQLKSKGNKVFPNPNLVGIDTNNLIATFYSTSVIQYTAIQDCYCVITHWESDQTYFEFKINGTQIVRQFESPLSFVIALKKGQVFRQYGGGYTRYSMNVYGLKY